MDQHIMKNYLWKTDLYMSTYKNGCKVGNHFPIVTKTKQKKRDD